MRRGGGRTPKARVACRIRKYGDSALSARRMWESREGGDPGKKGEEVRERLAKGTKERERAHETSDEFRYPKFQPLGLPNETFHDRCEGPSCANQVLGLEDRTRGEGSDDGDGEDAEGFDRRLERGAKSMSCQVCEP